MLHAELDGIDRVGKIHREVFGFVGFHQSQHDFEAVTFRGARLGLIVEKRRERLERRAVVLIVANRTNVHGVHSISTVSASTASYCRCVPMNLM
ncbi:hypothetical protein D3C80_1942570 [compost metagenome]